mmetsp:Transcript_86753/g.169749  ORF Transcript_86753/g.169749 Transcript_86753/m.169749 type:complete len:109 (+) Transcript_86753:87-413(+)
MSALLQKRKKELRQELSQIEKQIYDLETTYLEETKEFGNIFTGWDAYLGAEKVKLRKIVLLEDRLFSLSSVTSPASRKEENKKAAKTDGGSARKKKKNTEETAEVHDE